MIINLFHLQGVLLDEVPPGLDLFTHEGAEHLVRFEGVIKVNKVRRPVTYWFPIVRYRYEWRGAGHESKNLGGLETSTTSKAHAERRAA